MEFLSEAAAHLLIWSTMGVLLTYVILMAYLEGRFSKKNLLMAMDPDDSIVSARASYRWYIIMLSLFATFVSSWVLFSPPEVGAAVGWWGVTGYVLSSVIPYCVLAVLGPKLWDDAPPDCLTYTDYAKYRFGVPTQILMLGAGFFSNFIALISHFTAIGHTWALLAPGFPPAAAIVPVAAVTTFYVFLGGLKASIATDKVQGASLIMLLTAVSIYLLTSVEVHRAGWDEASSWTPEGFKTLVVLIVSVLPSGLMDSTSWQRIGAAKTQRDSRLGFISAALLVAPIMAVLGMIGVFARAAFPNDIDENLSVAFFLVLEGAPVAWKGLVGVLTILAVSSSIDSAQMAMTSFIGRDIKMKGINLNWAMAVGALLNVPAAVIGCLGFSVFHLFLIGNLITGAFVAPLFLGLWPNATPIGAFAGCVTGFCSIPILGWCFTRTFVGGFTWFILPDGYDTTSAIVTYITVPMSSVLMTVAASVLDSRFRSTKGSTGTASKTVAVQLCEEPSATSHVN